MSERTSVRVVLAVAILAATVLPSAAQVFRADRERSEAFDMRVVAMIPPIVVHPRATGPIVATVLHPQTVSAVRVRATVAANSPTPWTIRFKTLAGETVEQFSDASPQVVQGELWSDTIPGRGAEIEVTGAPAVTVTIDAYAHAEAQTTPQSIHGKNQLIAIGIAPPEAVRFAKPVGRLRFMTRKGQAFCSGFLVASTLFMTNNHCIATAAEAASAVVELGYDGYAATVSRHRVSRLEATDAPLDMSLPQREMPKRSNAPRPWQFAAAAVALIALAGAGVTATRRYVAPTPATSEGTLSMTTNPPGAKLYVDGVERGTTPLTVTLKTGAVREASQGHFRGGREEPLSSEALEAKFVANCIYGGWDASRARRVLAVLRRLRTAPKVDLSALRG